ncbi:hypothetical protein VNO80_05078 [Phaseolus coccineus]|uniref:Uncharacterized protein n=1 Tax=Phaseolus coccineus TaxID=3886 RepID=A0AAN9NZZ1_PHACN
MMKLPLELIQSSCSSLVGSRPLRLILLQAEMATNSPPKEDGGGMQERNPKQVREKQGELKIEERRRERV